MSNPDQFPNLPPTLEESHGVIKDQAIELEQWQQRCRRNRLLGLAVAAYLSNQIYVGGPSAAEEDGEVLLYLLYDLTQPDAAVF